MASEPPTSGREPILHAPMRVSRVRRRGAADSSGFPCTKSFASPTSSASLVQCVHYGPAAQLGPVCAPAQRPAVARALRRALAEAPWRWDIFFGEQLWAEDGWGGLFGGKLIQRTPSPVLRFRGSWNDFLALK